MRLRRSIRSHPTPRQGSDARPVDLGALISVRELYKTFDTLDATIVAAAGISLDIPHGVVTALSGPSGSGKSTLLHLIGALDAPDSGTIAVAGTNITELKGTALADYRRRTGFIFQRFNLVPTLTVLDNVTAPVLPFKTSFDPKTRAMELLRQVGLAGRENTLATRLSGGQQQRVAIARALINAPELILADEPTGNLDSSTGADIIDLLFGLRDQHGTTLLIATHDPALAGRCDHAILLRDGQLIDHARHPMTLRAAGDARPALTDLEAESTEPRTSKQMGTS